MADAPPNRSENRLANETSAYLRQHMHNPVDWYPWGREALERARTEDRPILVSIGYSACHWCHVMAHESFEDAATAAVMNQLFVNVKVDREERPDVDQLYMDTVVALTGHGGWPLTAFCTPDGRPFYAGTYFPPEARHGLPAFRDVLTGVADAYRNRRGEVDDTARRIVEALSHRPEGGAGETPGIATAARAAVALLQQADPENGGFGSAPKFPTPTSLELLLAADDVLPQRKAREAPEHVFDLEARRQRSSNALPNRCKRIAPAAHRVVDVVEASHRMAGGSIGARRNDRTFCATWRLRPTRRSAGARSPSGNDVRHDRSRAGRRHAAISNAKAASVRNQSIATPSSAPPMVPYAAASIAIDVAHAREPRL